MPVELPSARDALITPVNFQPSEQVQSNAIYEQREPQVIFTELDSELQGVRMIAYAIENDRFLPEELRMSDAKRGEMEGDFKKRAERLGVTTNRQELLEAGGYDSNGTNILQQREKLLQTGKKKEHVLLEFPIIDTDQQLATISVASAD